ncbi:unnamed protein product [Cunninghamella echinulata]
MDYNRFFSAVHIPEDHNNYYIGKDFCIQNTAHQENNPEEQCKRIMNSGQKFAGPPFNCTDYRCGLFGCAYGGIGVTSKDSIGFIAHCDKSVAGFTLFSSDFNKLVPLYSFNMLFICLLFFIFLKK